MRPPLRAFSLPPVELFFANGKLGFDKLRGLLTYGPYRSLANTRPRFGFVFPRESRDYANKLFLALKNGIGMFPGVENAFRFQLTTEQVFPITVSGIRISSGEDQTGNARAYADAIRSWQEKDRENSADFFFVLHPKTSGFELATPYYEYKALLLREGWLSQSVTLELLDNANQFQWSIANIALGAFVKLGGIPWVVKGEGSEQDLIVGIGRAYLFDPQSRKSTQYLAFTACFSARGPLRFISLTPVVDTWPRYLEALQKVLTTTLEKADKQGNSVSSLTIHVPKEMRRQEMEIIQSSVRSHVRKTVLQTLVARVNEESNFFAVDDSHQDGVPKRGTVIQISDRELMVYTEGREEREPWTSRPPVALRVTPQGQSPLRQQLLSVVRQINDLSQVNWRGLNARSKPISIYYGSLIAQLLSHLSPQHVADLYRRNALQTLEERLWFL